MTTVFQIDAITEQVMLGVSLGNEACVPCVQCSKVGAEYIYKAARLKPGVYLFTIQFKVPETMWAKN